MTLGRLRLSVADARDLGVPLRYEIRYRVTRLEDLGQARILIAAHGGINHVVGKAICSSPSGPTSLGQPMHSSGR